MPIGLLLLILGGVLALGAPLVALACLVQDDRPPARGSWGIVE